METFGQKLRQAIKSQGLPLEEVARETGLRIEQLRALEQDDFGALPEDHALTESLRSFARLLAVDPEEVIADYRREKERWRASKLSELEVVDEPEDIEPWVVAVPSKSWLGRAAALSLAALALAIVVFLFATRPSTAPRSSPLQATHDRTPLTEAGVGTRNPPGAPTRAAVSTPREADSSSASTTRVATIEPPAEASTLSIQDYGVGKGVINKQLVGESERFTEGERVWFWTLIEGGNTSESVDHVWLHDGEEILRVTLDLGGARWRTKSYKDLSPGSKGDWAVEARDESGRVLARQEFTCSPRRARPR